MSRYSQHLLNKPTNVTHEQSILKTLTLRTKAVFVYKVLMRK